MQGSGKEAEQSRKDTVSQHKDTIQNPANKTKRNRKEHSEQAG